MEFPRGQTGKIVCVLMPEVSTEAESLVKPIRDWSAKAKVSGATIRTTIAGMYGIVVFCELVLCHQLGSRIKSTYSSSCKWRY